MVCVFIILRLGLPDWIRWLSIFIDPDDLSLPENIDDIFELFFFIF
jgi:hypothetical protein